MGSDIFFVFPIVFTTVWWFSIVFYVLFSFWFAGANVDVHYLLPEVVVVLVARELKCGVLLFFLLL